MCSGASVFLLNISNILLVTKKPPAILTDETKTATEAKNCGTECGKTPPPNIKRPPAAVKPEIALVSDIKGV